jgi:hypothetical protein
MIMGLIEAVLEIFIASDYNFYINDDEAMDLKFINLF